jgi:hypothetical protein
VTRLRSRLPLCLVALVAFVAVAVLVGCAGGTLPGAPTPTRAAQATPGATAAGPEPNAGFQMCDLMPGVDVQGRAPFSVPFKKATPMSSIPQGCVYEFEGDRDSASILLVVTDFQTPEDALTSHRNHEQDETNLGTPPQQIAGLGDTASAAGEDEVGVQTVVGRRVIDANLGGQWPDVTAAAKIASGTELIRLILSRLP